MSTAATAAARPKRQIPRLSAVVLAQIVDAFSTTDIVQYIRRKMEAERVFYSRGRPAVAAASAALAASRRPSAPVARPAAPPRPAAPATSPTATAAVRPPLPAVVPYRRSPGPDAMPPEFYRLARDVALVTGKDYGAVKRELARQSES